MSTRDNKTVYFVNVEPKLCTLDYQGVARLADECLDIFIGMTDEGRISVGFDSKSNAQDFKGIIAGFAKPKRSRKPKPDQPPKSESA